MRIAGLALVLLCASTAFAKDRLWQDAKVTKVSSSIEDSGAIVAVTYTPLRSRMAQPNGGRPLNVTLNGKTKIAVDGANLHGLDDAGKDVKVPIALKIARADPPADDASKQK
jgi:hypothetical protein